MDHLGKVVIVGVGLIGGSIGMALRSRDLARRVIGVGRDSRRLAEARARGVIDDATTELDEAVDEAEVIVLCTPVSRIPGDLRQVAEHASPGALVTDAGSTKRRIVETAEAHPIASSLFVGAHPIAGSERAGAAHARPDLFVDRVCALTPTPRTPGDRLRRARRFWESLGCQVLEISPAEHDEVLAFTSHLPHAVAAAMASAVPPEWLALAGGAFRDVTRVAAAETELWTAIFRDNRGPLLKAIGNLQDRIAAFKYAVMTDDEEAIRRWWNEARRRRELFESRFAASKEA